MVTFGSSSTMVTIIYVKTTISNSLGRISFFSLFFLQFYQYLFHSYDMDTLSFTNAQPRILYPTICPLKWYDRHLAWHLPLLPATIPRLVTGKWRGGTAEYMKIEILVHNLTVRNKEIIKFSKLFPFRGKGSKLFIIKGNLFLLYYDILDFSTKFIKKPPLSFFSAF